MQKVFPRGQQPAGELETGAFACMRCGAIVPPAAPGTRNRNHCPCCLWSRHVDLRTGDRRSGCRGAMEPVGVWVRPDGEWTLIHSCRDCGLIRANRIAGDDSAIALLSLALRPLARPPFPLNGLKLVPEVADERD